MEVTGLIHGSERWDRVPLRSPFLGIDHVAGLQLEFAHGSAGAGFAVPLVMFDRTSLLRELMLRLDRVAWNPPASAEPKLVQEARRSIGIRRWSELHPDLAGRFRLLGARRMFFPSVFAFLLRTQKRKGLRERGLAALEQAGREAHAAGVQTWRDAARLLHFPEPSKLPVADDLLRARAFFEGQSIRIAELDIELRSRSPRLGHIAQRKALRRALAKIPEIRAQPASVKNAATLLSYAHRLAQGNDIAREVQQRLPGQLLDKTGSKVYETMWIGDDQPDDRGRFLVPVMASPGAESIVNFLGGLRKKPNVHDPFGILFDLMSAISGGPPRRGVFILLGSAAAYFPWRTDEQETERHRKIRERYPHQDVDMLL